MSTISMSHSKERISSLKKFNTSKYLHSHKNHYRRSPRNLKMSLNFDINKSSHFHANSVLSRLQSPKSMNPIQSKDKLERISTKKSTFHLKSQQKNIKQSKLPDTIKALEDPAIVNQEIEDFMKRLKNDTNNISHENYLRVKTIYFEDTNLQTNSLQSKRQCEDKYANKGFCRISHENWKKFTDTEAYRKYKEQKKRKQNYQKSKQKNTENSRENQPADQ